MDFVMKKSSVKVPLLMLLFASMAYAAYDCFKRYVRIEFNIEQLDDDEGENIE